MNVFELFAVLGLDTSQYESGLKSAEDSANSFGSILTSGLGAAAGVAAAAVAATTTAVVAGSAAFIDGVASTAEYADSIDKLSQKMGFGVESFQEWQYVAQISGTSMESLKAGMKTLATAVETGSDAFDKLGLSQEQLAGMSQEEVFEATITALQGVEDQSERTYLAGQLLGKGATELGPMLNLTAEEMDALKQEAHDLGGVLSEDQVKAGAAFQDSLLGMQTALDGLKNNMMSEFLPSFTTVMDGLALIFSGDDSGLTLIEDGVNELADKISEQVPKFIEIGGSIISTLASALVKNLPVLLTSGAQAVSQIATGIISELPSIIPAILSVADIIVGTLLDNADSILVAGIQIVLTLANGLTEALPTLLPSISSIIKELVLTLTEPSTLSMIWSAALQLILALGEGLVQAIPELVSIIPIYYVNITTTMIQMFPEILNAALMLLGELGMAIFGVVGGLLGMNYDEIVNYTTLAFDFIAGWGSDLINGIANWFNDATAQTAIFLSDTISSIVGFFTNIYQSWYSWEMSIINGVASFFSDMVSFYQNGFNSALDFVSSFGTDFVNSMIDTWDNAISIVTDGVNSLIGLLGFDWSLPDLKLPHFNITGQLDLLATPPTYPTVSIDWYKKAMDTPYLLDSATIFGAANGRYLGGGEAGAEMIYSHDKLMDDIGSVVDSKLSKLTLIAPIYIGGEKIDEVVVKSNQRNDYISGGR